MEMKEIESLFETLSAPDTCIGADRREHLVFTVDGSEIKAIENIEHFSDREDRISWSVSFPFGAGRTASSYEEACQIADLYAQRKDAGADAQELTRIMREGAESYWGE